MSKIKVLEKVSETPLDEKTGLIFNGENIENKEENTYSAETIDKLIEEYSGVKEGTIVDIPKSETTPEGWEDITDEDEITLVEFSELFTIVSGFTYLNDSNIFKQRNRYFGSITIQKNSGKFSTSDEKVVTFKKTIKTQANTGCWLGGSQWDTHNVGYCFIGSGKISVSDRNGTGYYNYAKITFDIVTDETIPTKTIKKISTTRLSPITGSIVNGTNFVDKEHNTYSANTIDGLVLDTYSTTEQVVGTWIDGKPIYRKVIVQDLTSANISIDVGYRNFINIYGTIYSKYGNRWTIPNHPYGVQLAEYFCDLFTSGSTIYLDLGSSMYGEGTAQANLQLIVEYTK